MMLNSNFAILGHLLTVPKGRSDQQTTYGVQIEEAILLF